MKLPYARSYLDCGGTSCPFCWSDDIGGGAVNIEGGKAFQHLSCNDCAEQWTDVYTLTCIHVNGMSYDGTATENERSYGHDRENNGVPVPASPGTTE